MTQWMKRNTMFLDWKNHNCQNDYTTQGNLQTQHNSYQITDDIFSQSQNRKSQDIYVDTKDPEQPKQY